MLIGLPHTALARVRDEHGFTLVELLVAMVAGIAVTGALFSILVVSLHQTARLTDRVQVDQTGRTAMTKMIDELQSSCLSYSFAPILSKSTIKELRFVNAYSAESVITKAAEHRIVWDEKKETLTDSYSTNTGGSWPIFTFGEPTTKVVIANNVRQATIGGKVEPIFGYYTYAEAAEGSLTTPLTALTLLENEEVTAVQAPTVASVKITYSQAPSNGYPTSTGVDRNAIFSTQTTLAFSVPKAEDPIHDAPCQ